MGEIYDSLLDQIRAVAEIELSSGFEDNIPEQARLLNCSAQFQVGRSIESGQVVVHVNGLSGPKLNVVGDSGRACLDSTAGRRLDGLGCNPTDHAKIKGLMI